MDNLTVLFILKFSLIVALLNIDTRNILPLGISRPIITGMILGYLLNNIYYGLFAGCIIELLLINSLPVGGFIPLNGAIITGIVMIISHYFHIPKAGILLPAILIYAIFCGHVVQRVARMLLRKNIIIVDKFFKEVQELKFPFFFCNFSAFLIDYLTFFIVTFIGSFLGIILFNNIVSSFFTSYLINSGFEKALYYLPLLAFVFVLNSFDVHRKVYFLFIGIIASFILSLFVSNPILVILIVGVFSYIMFYSIHFYKEHYYGI